MVYVINRWVLYEKVRGKYTIKKYISYKKKIYKLYTSWPKIGNICQINLLSRMFQFKFDNQIKPIIKKKSKALIIELLSFSQKTFMNSFNHLINYLDKQYQTRF